MNTLGKHIVSIVPADGVFYNTLKPLVSLYTLTPLKSIRITSGGYDPLGRIAIHTTIGQQTYIDWAADMEEEQLSRTFNRKAYLLEFTYLYDTFQDPTLTIEYTVEEDISIRKIEAHSTYVKLYFHNQQMIAGKMQEVDLSRFSVSEGQTTIYKAKDSNNNFSANVTEVGNDKNNKYIVLDCTTGYSHEITSVPIQYKSNPKYYMDTTENWNVVAWVRITDTHTMSYQMDVRSHAETIV